MRKIIVKLLRGNPAIYDVVSKFYNNILDISSKIYKPMWYCKIILLKQLDRFDGNKNLMINIEGAFYKRHWKVLDFKTE